MSFTATFTSSRSCSVLYVVVETVHFSNTNDLNGAFAETTYVSYLFTYYTNTHSTLKFDHLQYIVNIEFVIYY